MKDKEDSMIFQIARFLSVYDVYVNLISLEDENEKYFMSKQFSKDNMLILVLSNLYALVDDQKKAQSLMKMKFSDPNVEKLRIDLINKFEKIKDSLRHIRHNLGFHTSAKLDGQKSGTGAFKDLDEEVFILINELKKIYLEYVIKSKI